MVVELAIALTGVRISKRLRFDAYVGEGLSLLIAALRASVLALPFNLACF